MAVKILKNFTRGGQMTMHALRMIGQASKYVIKITIVLGMLCYFTFFMTFSTEQERYLLKEYWVQSLRVSLNPDRGNEYISLKTVDGRVASMQARDFINHEGSSKNINSCKRAAWYAFFATLASAFFIILIIGKIFVARSKRLSKIQPIRGSKFDTPENLKKKIVNERNNSIFTIANIPMVKKSETQHILMTGTVGTGKSVALTELMDQVRFRKQKAIVYDCDGSYISTYYRPEKDIILNPLDERSPCWNIWQECRDSADFEAFAESLMPLHLANSDPFWINAARTIFSTAAFQQRLLKPTTRQLLGTLLTESLDDITNLIKNTVAETLVSEKIEKTALSIKATLSTHCKSLLYLPDERGCQDLFSIRKWIHRDTEDSWLFIATNKEKAPALRSLMSAWLDIAVRSILSLPSSFQRRLWFFVDELPSLYQIPSLKEVLAEGRKFGACFTATVQDIHQLRLIYGREATEALLSLFNTKVCFRTGSSESALWAERTMGSHEVLEIREGYSYGANDIRDGVTLNQERRKESIVMDSQFLDLNDLEAYLRFPGDYPVTKVKFDIKKRKEVQVALIEREMPDISIIEGKVLQEGENNKKENKDNNEEVEDKESKILNDEKLESEQYTEEMSLDEFGNKINMENEIERV